VRDLIFVKEGCVVWATLGNLPTLHRRLLGLPPPALEVQCLAMHRIPANMTRITVKIDKMNLQLSKWDTRIK
jgi:hypothetical protein